MHADQSENVQKCNLIKSYALQMYLQNIVRYGRKKHGNRANAIKSKVMRIFKCVFFFIIIIIIGMKQLYEQNTCDNIIINE